MVFAPACSRRAPVATSGAAPADNKRAGAASPQGATPSAPPPQPGAGALDADASTGPPLARFHRRENRSSENEKWIPLHLSSEGIEVPAIRFAVERGIHWNPQRAGKEPQAFMPIKNASDHEMKLAVAIALFDVGNAPLSATEITYGGSLAPGGTGELRLIFRDVKRRFFDAATAQAALETYR
jgi:hypothetical protein